MTDYRLYVWIRSDLASMTPGKACAQVAHAASQAAGFYNRNNQEDQWVYKRWEDSAATEARPGSKFAADAFEKFGTTIVLDGVDDITLEELYYITLPTEQCADDFGIVVDPTYPLKDGKKLLFVEMLTCVWMFADADHPAVDKLSKKFSLYNGSTT